MSTSSKYATIQLPSMSLNNEDMRTNCVSTDGTLVSSKHNHSRSNEPKRLGVKVFCTSDLFTCNC